MKFPYWVHLIDRVNVLSILFYFDIRGGGRTGRCGVSFGAIATPARCTPEIHGRYLPALEGHTPRIGAAVPQPSGFSHRM